MPKKVNLITKTLSRYNNIHSYQTKENDELIIVKGVKQISKWLTTCETTKTTTFVSICLENYIRK